MESNYKVPAHWCQDERAALEGTLFRVTHALTESFFPASSPLVSDRGLDKASSSYCSLLKVVRRCRG